MSKVVYICFNKPEFQASLKEDIMRASKRILPDNINSTPVRIGEYDGLMYGVINPTDLLVEKDGNILSGKLFDETCEWWSANGKTPDGSFAIFRNDSERVEVLTDVVGSRSVWIYKNDDIFIASTSQRAISIILKSFEFNRNVIPWLLSSGGLGYGNAWDSRVTFVPADSRVVLDRKSWSITIVQKPVEFSPSNDRDKSCEASLREEIKKTFQNLNFDFSKWALPLSGGYDSRSILCFINNYGKGIENVKTVTWGVESARNKQGNDAYVAKKVADHFKIPNQYFAIDSENESLEKILDRFLVCGEGRIDHIGGYMDGFKTWKTLFENGVQGIIRGDEGFGYPPVDSAVHVRKLLGIPLCDDFTNLKDYKKFGFPEQKLPLELQQKEGETLSTWRDRLYHAYRIPTVLAALSDLKLSFVELVNPLLARNLIYQVRQLPDHLRTDKILFKKIADSVSPNITYATSSATESASHMLSTPEMVGLIKDELNSERAKSIFPPEFLENVNSNLKVRQSAKKSKARLFKTKIISLLKRFAPRRLHLYYVRKIQKSPTISYNLIAFRVFILSRMNRLFLQDSSSSLHEDHATVEKALVDQ